MRNLEIPAALRVEFATVEAIWAGSGRTRTVDAFVLSWVKYEKQLRKLFSFFVFQHPAITRDMVDQIVLAFVSSRNLYPETFIAGIRKLGVTPLPELLGDNYPILWREIERIKKYRNKIMHGQLTGEDISSEQLERDIIHIIRWMTALAEKADDEFGYDGLKRNVYRHAKSQAKIQADKYPFRTAEELQAWLSKLRP